MSELPIIISERQSVPEGTLGSHDAEGKLGSIATEKLHDSLTTLSREFATIMKDIKEVGGFKLTAVQIQAGIDAKAGFVLIGEAGVKGTVTLTFSNK